MNLKIEFFKSKSQSENVFFCFQCYNFGFYLLSIILPLSIVTEDDLDRVWSCVENSIRVMMDSSSDEDKE